METSFRRRIPAGLTAVRARVLRFEITHGVGPHNWRDAFRDASGALHDSDELLTMEGLYFLLGDHGLTGAA